MLSLMLQLIFCAAILFGSAYAMMPATRNRVIDGIAHKRYPIPGQTWIVDGIGECIVNDVSTFNRFGGQFEFEAKLIHYHIASDPVTIHVVERHHFMSNAKLVEAKSKS